ncbi:hypothetical protein PQX77_014435 [Marasmius sp. AFHP31]|nr:hypothetical protein PQX77_014435 [Marasmius sp. AFHP31]
MASPKPEIRPAKSTPGPDSEPPPKVKRKAGRESPFSESQQVCIAAKFPEWEDLLVAHHVQFGKDGRKADPPAVCDWVNNTADALLALPEFGDLNLAVKDRKGWKTSLLDTYKNYRHHVIIPKYTTQLVEDYLRNHGRGMEERHMSAAQAFKVISAFQQGPPTAKAIFAQENATKIQEVASDLLVKDQTLNGCNAGAHAKALTDLWKAADHATYEQKARDQAQTHDIYQNLETFSQGLHATLSEVASNGLLGNLEICFVLGSRDPDDAIAVRLCRVNMDLRSDDPSGTRASFEDAWCRWIEQKIKPNNPTPELDSRIRKNTAGIPILSGLDIEKAVTEDLRVIVDTILTSSQQRTDQSSGQKNIPYEAIAVDPSKFYDTENFNLPVPLGPPRTILPGPFYILVDFFTKLDPSTPFVFLPHPEKPAAVSNRDADQEIPLSLDPLSLQDPPTQQTGTGSSILVPPAVFDPQVGNPTVPTLLNRVKGDIAPESVIGPEHSGEPMNMDPTNPGSEPVVGGDMEAEGSPTQGAASHQQTLGQEIAPTVASQHNGVTAKSISDPRTEVQDVRVKPPHKSRSRKASGKRKPPTRKDRRLDSGLQTHGEGNTEMADVSTAAANTKPPSKKQKRRNEEKPSTGDNAPHCPWRGYEFALPSEIPIGSLDVVPVVDINEPRSSRSRAK